MDYSKANSKTTLNIILLSITFLYCYAESRYTECSYGERCVIHETYFLLLKVVIKYIYCTKRLIVSFKSSLLVTIIYKCTKLLQLFTSAFTLNTNIFTSNKVIYKHMYLDTKVIKNVNCFKTWTKLKLYIGLGLMK